MLRELTLHNFQSHENTTIEFSPNVTLITGQSNNGKTAILRSLRWVFDNRPLGDDFIRDNCKDCSVKLVADGFIIERIKNPTMNGYTFLSLPARRGTQKVEFTAIGFKVPEEVSKALNMGEINVQHQLDPYFLVFDSPGEVGNYVNQIMHLDEIEKVVDYISKLIRGENANLKLLKEDQEKKKESLKFYKSLDLETYKENLQQYNDIKDNVKKRDEELDKLSTLILDIERIEKELNVIPDVSSLLEKSKQLPGDITELQEFVLRLRNLINSLQELQCPLLCLDNSQLEISSEVQELENSIDQGEKESDTLFDLISKIKNVDKDIQEVQSLIDAALSEKEDLMEQLTICPYCESLLDDEHKTILLDTR